MKTPNTFVIYFHSLYSKGKYTDMDVYWAEVTFFIPIEEIDFFSLVLLLFCAVLLVTVLFLFQKAAINNTLISQDCLWNFMLWNE